MIPNNMTSSAIAGGIYDSLRSKMSACWGWFDVAPVIQVKASSWLLH